MHFRLAASCSGRLKIGGYFPMIQISGKGIAVKAVVDDAECDEIP